MGSLRITISGMASPAFFIDAAEAAGSSLLANSSISDLCVRLFISRYHAFFVWGGDPGYFVPVCTATAPKVNCLNRTSRRPAERMIPANLGGGGNLPIELGRYV